VRESALVPFLLREATTTHDLSSGSLNFTPTILRRFQFEQILVRSDTNIEETFNVTFDSRNGSNFDVLLGAMDFDGLSNIVLVGGESLVRALCDDNDNVRLTTDGNATSGILYITVKFSLLHD